LKDITQTTKQRQQQQQQQENEKDEAGTAAASAAADGVVSTTTSTVAESTGSSSTTSLNQSTVVTTNFNTTKKKQQQQQDDKEPKKKFRILCTARGDVMNYGSYKLRCEDFQYWIHRCAPRVILTTGISWQEVLNGMTAGERRREEGDVFYDSTLIVKYVPSFAKKRKFNFTVPVRLGYCDMVDQYHLNRPSHVYENYTLIFQTERQHRSDERYSHHGSYRVVEHWYNSYRGDMTSGTLLPKYVPPIKFASTELKLATVMEFGKDDSCPTLDHAVNVTYDCMNRRFQIENWYVDELIRHHREGTTTENETSSVRRQMKDDMNTILDDPSLGRGGVVLQDLLQL
jgi:hypothetical protein